MMSKKDFDALVQLIKTTVKDEIDPVKEIVKFLPSKDLFLSKMAELMKEIKGSREEQTAISGYKNQIEDHETRLNEVEKVLNIPPQS